jgi:DNA-binding NarL/FixJ family response regulator
MMWRMGDSRGAPNILLWLAVLAARTRRMVRAARLLGAADAQHEHLGASPEMPPDGLDDLCAATLHGELAVAREKGRALTLQAAIDEACGEGEADERVVVRASPRNARLTRRELEIAALVAQGLSNLQIAQRLVITEGTTQNHLSHILDKLGLTSRTQVAAWLLAEHELG